MNRLRSNYRAMIRWICNVKVRDEVSPDTNLSQLSIQGINEVGWARRAKHRLDYSMQVECVCTGKTWQAKETWHKVLFR